MTKIQWLSFTIIISLAAILRFADFASFPVFGETQDEVAWTWLGTSILQGQLPTSWSGTHALGYDLDYVTTFDGQGEFRIVSPYLDNPYLFSLIPAAAALAAGYPDIEIPSLVAIRFPMVLIGIANVGLLFFVAKKLFTFKIAAMSSLLYATVPTFVYASRLVVAENLLITIMLISILLLWQQLKHPSPKYAWGIGLLGGLALLTKISGLVIPIAVAIILFHHRQKSAALKVLLSSLIIGSLYPLYGLWVNSELFLQVLSKQADFPIGLATILDMFIYPQLARKTLIDGWVYFGLLSLFWLISTAKLKSATSIIATFGLLWFAFIITATPEAISNGWYKYPLFPLYSLSIALFMRQYYHRQFFPVVLSLLVGLPLFRLSLMAQDIELSKLLTRIVVVITYLPLIITSFTSSIVRRRTIMLGLLIVLIGLNAMVIFGFNQVDYWRDSLYFYPVRIGD